MQLPANTPKTLFQVKVAYPISSLTTEESKIYFDDINNGKYISNMSTQAITDVAKRNTIIKIKITPPVSFSVKQYSRLYKPKSDFQDNYQHWFLKEDEVYKVELTVLGGLIQHVCF